ncbi:hypothetical protein C8R45DRAFT_538261 [Mycena sanguinolenta]|nr:hypothetical protein C8R45DRAFT_538261 [Mycena sanguinolenta]
MQPFDDIPTELIVKILCKLPYRSLLVVLGVSKRFNAILTEDPELSVQLFKRLSKVYVEPIHDELDDERSRRGMRSICTENSEPVRLHPAIPMVSYRLGNGVENAYLWTRKLEEKRHLMGLPIANNFVSIPVVTMMKIKVPNHNNSFNVVVKNPKGVRLVDFFRALAKESGAIFQDHSAYYGHKTGRAAFLGDHVHYEELEDVTKEGLLLTGTIWFGS